MATVFLGCRWIAYDRLSASWKDNLLVSIMQNQHSSYSMSSSRNTNESCHLRVWLFHDNAPVHKSLVAQQALCDCEFVQLNHPAHSPDLAAGDYFLMRNLKYHVKPGLQMMNHRRSLSRHGLRVKTESSIFKAKQLRRKVEKMHWRCRRMCQKMT